MNPPPQMRSGAGLSEDDIKRLFVPFLRDFYRTRYEPQANTEYTSLDNVSEGGVVADGFMSFRKKDGSPFVCTYEATSRDKAEEVKYSLNLSYFLWDCAAFGVIVSTVVYLYSYQKNLPWLVSLKAVGNFGFVLGLGMIAFFCWYFTMNKWRKYRYIYAIQQFKQYAAHEQWIALADDVFPAPTDPYMVELRNQSVYNGFGLAIVSANGAVRVIHAPSRLGIYGEGRKMIHWLTRAQWYQAMSQGLGSASRIWTHPPDAWTVVWNKISRPLRYLIYEPLKRNVWAVMSKPFGQTVNAYSRFMKGQITQKLIFFISLFVLLFMLYKVLSIKEENLADIEKLKEWRSGQNPEDQRGHVIDGKPIPYDGVAPGIPKQYPLSNSAPEEEDVPTIDLSGNEDTEPEPIKETSPAKTTVPAKKAAPKVQATNTSADACALLQGKKGWVVQDNVFSSRTNAQERATLLQQSNFTVHWAAMTCIEPDKTGYIVWLGAISATETDAKNQMNAFSKKMQAAGIKSQRLFIKKLD